MEISISNVGVPLPRSHSVWNVVCLPPPLTVATKTCKRNMTLNMTAACRSGFSDFFFHRRPFATICQHAATAAQSLKHDSHTVVPKSHGAGRAPMSARRNPGDSPHKHRGACRIRIDFVAPSLARHGSMP